MRRCEKALDMVKRWLCTFILSAGLMLAPARADEAEARRAYEATRHDTPTLTAFLRRMPKGADLHLHLDGAVDTEFLLDQAVERALHFDPATRTFEDVPGPGRIPAAALLNDNRNLRLFLDAASMRNHAPGELGHDHFFDAFSAIHSAVRFIPTALIMNAVVQDAAAQNTQYLEVMISPNASHALRKQAHRDLTDLGHALATLAPHLETYVTQARAEIDALEAGRPQGEVTVRYIIEVNRELSDGEFFASVAGAMRLMQVDPRVVGINPVAPEDAPPARRGFAAQMRTFDFLWNRLGKPALTMHAGELTPQFSSLEPMRTHIRQSIETGHARRIGHGVAIAWDDDANALLEEMRRRHVAVEVCLTSNDLILGVRGRAHPIHLYHRAGVPITINTDDPGISRSNLTVEYTRLVTTLHPRYDELKDIVRNSLEYAFLPGESLYLDHDYRALQPDLAGVRAATWAPSPAARRRMAASEKLRQQVRLERAWVEFERSFPH